jgi:hypothetical protein
MDPRPDEEAVDKGKNVCPYQQSNPNSMFVQSPSLYRLRYPCSGITRTNSIRPLTCFPNETVEVEVFANYLDKNHEKWIFSC